MAAIPNGIALKPVKIIKYSVAFMTDRAKEIDKKQ
jgi:hypothetical protein